MCSCVEWIVNEICTSGPPYETHTEKERERERERCILRDAKESHSLERKSYKLKTKKEPPHLEGSSDRRLCVMSSTSIFLQSHIQSGRYSKRFLSHAWSHRKYRIKQSKTARDTKTKQKTESVSNSIAQNSSNSVLVHKHYLQAEYAA